MSYYCAERDSVEINFWRSYAGDEVDFILNREIGVEVKASRSIGLRHLNGLNALSGLMQLKRKIIVCRESIPKNVNGVEILPWRDFVEQLWAGEII